MELLITFIASILVWIMFGGLFILWIVDGRIKKEQALHAFLSAVVAWTISQMIKQIYPTPRPYHINGREPLTISMNHYEGSFPSSHTALAFAIAFAVYLHTKKLGYLFIVGAVLVALGRVLSNVHYFTDVLAGGTIGVMVAYLLEKLHVYRLINNSKKSK